LFYCVYQNISVTTYIFHISLYDTFHFNFYTGQSDVPKSEILNFKFSFLIRANQMCQKVKF